MVDSARKISLRPAGEISEGFVHFVRCAICLMPRRSAFNLGVSKNCTPERCFVERALLVRNGILLP